MSNVCKIVEGQKNLVTMPVGRAMFVNLDKPVENRKFPDNDPKYGLTVAYSDDTDLSVLVDEMKRIGGEKWGSNVPPKAKIKLRTIAGDLKDLEIENVGTNWGLAQKGDLKGQRTIQAQNVEAPVLVDADNKTISTIVVEDPKLMAQIKNTFYPGCYVQFSFAIYAGDSNFSFYLKGVKFVRDGERLGAPPASPADMFGEPTGGSAQDATKSDDSGDGWD